MLFFNWFAKAPKANRLVANNEAIGQYHALDNFQKFWAALAEEELLAVPLDPKICKPFGGFAART